MHCQKFWENFIYHYKFLAESYESWRDLSNYLSNVGLLNANLKSTIDFDILRAKIDILIRINYKLANTKKILF